MISQTQLCTHLKGNAMLTRHMDPPALQVQFLNAANPAPAVPVMAAMSAGAPLTTSGIKAGSPVDLTGLYTTPVIITDTNRSTVRRQACSMCYHAIHECSEEAAAPHAAAVRHRDICEG